jgi:hypothetical protein
VTFGLKTLKIWKTTCPNPKSHFGHFEFLVDETIILIGPIIHGAHPKQDSPIFSPFFSIEHFRTYSTFWTMSMSRRCRNVCLFGLSADPPTGTGGHVGIVQALTLLRAPAPASQQQDDGDDDDDDDDGGSFAFDEIRVLPVYRHTYAVSG